MPRELPRGTIVGTVHANLLRLIALQALASWGGAALVQRCEPLR